MRVAFNKGKDRIINAITTESMLRYLPGTKARHTIKRPIQIKEHKPKSATDTFYEYTKDVISRMEEPVEKMLLHQYMDTLETTLEKQEVLDAYHQRKRAVKNQVEKDAGFIATPDPNRDKYTRLTPEIVPLTLEEKEDVRQMIASYDGQGLSYHTYDTIGKLTIFPRSHWRRMFPREDIGNFGYNDLRIRQYFALMCTEESLKITYDLSRRTLPKDRKVNYTELIKSSTEMKEILKDEQMFVQIYQDFSIDLLDLLHER
jgi:hypothetical protein